MSLGQRRSGPCPEDSGVLWAVLVRMVFRKQTILAASRRMKRAGREGVAVSQWEAAMAFQSHVLGGQRETGLGGGR